MASGNSRKNTIIIKTHGPIMKQFKCKLIANIQWNARKDQTSDLDLLFDEMDMTLER